MKKTLIGLAVVPVLALTACSETFTFEAHPTGTTGDDYTGDPASIQCFVIEADSSNGDDGDVQLGVFCKDRSRAVLPLDDDDLDGD